MHFLNTMTEAVLIDDNEFHFSASLISNTLAHCERPSKDILPKWKESAVDCHSMARLVFLFNKECRLVDGFLLGINKTESDEFFIQKTCHSWIETPNKAIVDPYPMGIISLGSTILVPTSKNIYNVHGSNLYREDITAKKYFDARESWDRALSHKRLLSKYCSKKRIKESLDFLINI